MLMRLLKADLARGAVVAATLTALIALAATLMSAGTSLVVDSLSATHRLSQRAKLPDLHFHDLRHEAASRLAEKLSNVLELSAVTGHRDLRMLKRYYHLRAEDLAKKLG